MKVTPKTEAEIAAMNLRDPGEYDFLVTEATDKLSAKGNEMVELKLQMEDSEGRTFTVFDYLVSIDVMAYKIRHFAQCVGLMDQYDAGDMAAEYIQGRTGKAKVGVQPAKGQYQAKNIVTDYIPAPLVSSSSTVANGRTAAELDDEIPF